MTRADIARMRGLSGGHRALVELHAIRPQITRRGRMVRFLAITAGATAVFSAGLVLPHPSNAEYRMPAPAHLNNWCTESWHPASCAAHGDNEPTFTVYEEDERGFDCRTMGNAVCGARVDVSACAPVGSAAAAADGCPVWGKR